KDILVSAAAGSGKTAVLVERIIGRVTDEKNPIDIDRLLVVTFTNAAAAEMRERIGAALDAACKKNPGNAHLMRQAVLVHNAKITTIDSFCLFVVRNHFDEIGLDPDFRIADEGEVKLLEMDVLDSVFEENYSDEDNEKFLQFIDCYSTKRSDSPVKDMVRRIYDMSLSNPWPREWIEGLLKPYRDGQGSAPMEDLIGNVRMLISDMADEMKSLAEIAAQPDGPNPYAHTISEEAGLLYEIAKCSDFDKLRVYFKNPPFKKLDSIRNFKGDPEKKEMVSARRNAIKKEFQDIGKKYFHMSLEEVEAQQERLLPVAEGLVRLSLSYSEAMAAQKRKKRIVDFSDIEHFALEILVDPGTKKSRRTAEEFRRHFDEIMIDEYQDSNQVQEVIMKAISKNEEGGHNIFMVGDVKQSIYRFRLARPELFMEKHATFDTGDGSDEIRIDLSQNFRSREEVTKYCNDIFHKIMAADLGSVAYDKDAELNCGAKYPSCTGTEPELLLLDAADEGLGEHDDLSKAQLEAHMAGWRIKKLMDEGQVTDKESGMLRPVRYSDIVILMRSLRDWGPVFSDTLGTLGIPSHVDSSTGYFSATEVQTVLSMLRILDNPYQDIPMAAVLRSPMAGLSDEELAEIRVGNQGATFAAAALAAMREAEEESGLGKFYDIYMRLRAMRDVPVHELIQAILDETGYGNYAAALPAGRQRSANLMMLIEKAVDYERTSYRGLFHFVRYIDQMEKYDIDFGEADVSGENADTVRIMTIHHSKGLEFPIVFVCGLGKSINQRETSEHLLLHADLGMGLCEISGRPRMKRHSLFEAQIAERIRRENLGEELRVLYVALTRAKEKLI
ncbi:MAG: helicase-exonuclease AddAB subunit AddA, partial [Clostridiales bacterium]|nr:helicase-exonuclease AddAB subunit AddA [Clostridiales bacterium]